MKVSERIQIGLNIISLGLLLYLIGSSFLEVDFAGKKNDHLIAFRKTEVDAIQDIDIIKERAKKDLETIRTIHKKHSVKSRNNLSVLFVLLIIQTFLLLLRKNPDR